MGPQNKKSSEIWQEFINPIWLWYIFAMKRKRTPSPPTQRRTSRSPLSPRSTRAAKRTPPTSNDKKENDVRTNGEELNIRRSSRARRLSYQSLHTGGGGVELQNGASPRSPLSPRSTRVTRATPQEHRRSRSSTPDTEETDRDTHFPSYNHVRFSPSAKPGSPARFSRRRAAASSIAKMRLQNVPSEDEQSVFNRRYSRDLRSRRQQERSDDRSTCTTRRSAQNQRSEPSKKEGDDDEDEEEEEEEEEEDENEETEPEPEVEPKVETKEKSEEEITPRRSGRSVRQRTPYNHTQTTDAEDERSEVESSKVAST